MVFLSFPLIITSKIILKIEKLNQAIGLYDESTQSMHVNRWNLLFLDRNVQRKYETMKKENSIKYSKVYLITALVAFSVYLIICIVSTPDSEIVVYTVYFFMGIIAYALLRTKKFKKFHYNLLSAMVALTVCVKICFDWVFSDYNKTLSGVLVLLLLSLAIHLKINFLHITIYIVIYVISYSLR